MRYTNGKWHYNGREYETFHDALVSVWPKRTESNP